MYLSYLIVILILLLYIFYFRSLKPNSLLINLFYLYKFKLFKTGDLIFYKCSNSLNCYLFNTYFTHIGIIYVDPTNSNYNPLLFEISNYKSTNFIYKKYPTYISLTYLLYNLISYKGEIYYKPLNKPVDKFHDINFKKFILFSHHNLSYGKLVPLLALSRKYLKNPFHFKINCAELVFFSLIKLNLLPINYFYTYKLNYLKYLINLKYLNNNYYHNFIKIIIPN